MVGGTLAGKYAIEGVLGEGGMGTVFVARHLELDEIVAVKVLRDDVAKNPIAVARFLREGKIAARIRSEHIVKVRDVGRTEEGAPYLVMEYLEGEDLEAMLEREGSFPVEFSVDCILQACDAIASAHAAGIVHRDLKPGNLFATRRRNGSLVIKVLDFGISKLGDLSEVGHRTNVEEVFGSPFYMSPEQLLSSATADARSDVWSLGVVLFELLTGQRPLDGSSLAQLHLNILQGTPLDPLSLRPDLPPELAATVLSCLVRDRDQRMASVQDLAFALAPYASEEGRKVLAEIEEAGAPRPSPSLPVQRGRIPSAVDAAASAPLPALPIASAGALAADTVLTDNRTEASWSSRPVPPAGRRRHVLLGGAVLGALLIGGALFVLWPRSPSVEVVGVGAASATEAVGSEVATSAASVPLDEPAPAPGPDLLPVPEPSGDSVTKTLPPAGQPPRNGATKAKPAASAAKTTPPKPNTSAPSTSPGRALDDR